MNDKYFRAYPLFIIVKKYNGFYIIINPEALGKYSISPGIGLCGHFCGRNTDNKDNMCCSCVRSTSLCKICNYKDI
jgi:hypothetical protein